jgi:4-aminobutyrate aminotransferase-like enzyme
LSENLVNESARKGKILENKLKMLQNSFPKIISDICGMGLVFAIHFKDPLTNKLNIEIVDSIIERCLHKGLLLVRTGSGTIKIGPPLMIPDDALIEGIEIIQESILECVEKKNND